MGRKEIEISVPQSWDEINVIQFQRLQEVDKDNYTELEYIIELVTILCDVNIEYIRGINLKNLNIISEQLKFLQTPVSTEQKKVIEIDGVKYAWKSDFQSLTLGEMISIEHVIKVEELSYTASYDVVMAVLMRKVKEDGTLEDFNAAEFTKNREIFSNVSINDINGMLVFFLNGNEHYMKTTVAYSLTQLMIQKITRMKNWLLKKK